MFDEPNRARAHVEYTPEFDGIRAVLLPRPGQIRQWPFAARVIRTVDEHAPDAEPEADDWLHLQRDEARALYEALGKYFGHDAVSTAALRSDYLAERKRVDKMVDGLLSVVTHPSEIPVPLKPRGGV